MEAHKKVMEVGLDIVNAVLPSPLYVEPMLPLVVTLAIFKTTLNSLYIAPKDKR